MEAISNYEEVIMKLIAYSGEAKGYAVSAEAAAKKGDFASADELLDKSKQSLKPAHESCFRLLSSEAKDPAFKVSLLMVHALGHFNDAEATVESVTRIVDVYKKITGCD